MDFRMSDSRVHSMRWYEPSHRRASGFGQRELCVIGRFFGRLVVMLSR